MRVLHLHLILLSLGESRGLRRISSRQVGDRSCMRGDRGVVMAGNLILIAGRGGQIQQACPRPLLPTAHLHFKQSKSQLEQ